MMEKNRGGPLKKETSQEQNRCVQGELYLRESDDSCLASSHLHRLLLSLVSFCVVPLTPAVHLNPHCLALLRAAVLSLLMAILRLISWAVFYCLQLNPTPGGDAEVKFRHLLKILILSFHLLVSGPAHPSKAWHF